MYQCQYWTINSSISECNYTCEIRNTTTEIGTDGSSQTQQNPRVDRYRSRYGPPRVSGWGFWTGQEQNDLFLRSKRGQLWGYPDRLLTLSIHQPLWPPSALQWSLHHGLWCITLVSPSLHSGVSPYRLDDEFHNCPIMAINCISKPPLSRPPS